MKALSRPDQYYNEPNGDTTLVRSAAVFPVTVTNLPHNEINEADTRLGLEAEGVLVDSQNLKAQDASHILDIKGLLPEHAELHGELNKPIIELAFNIGLDYKTLAGKTRESISKLLDILKPAGQDLLYTSVYPGESMEIIEAKIIEFFISNYSKAVAENISFMGLQLHKEFRDGNYAIHLYNHIRTVTHYLTGFILNSPFTQDGRHRGVYSERMLAKKFNVLGGVSPKIQFQKLDDYLKWFQNKIDMGIFEGASATNYDLRPLRFHTNTLEINNLDIAEDVNLWFALLDLYNALCEVIAIHYREGKQLPSDLFNSESDDETITYNRHQVAMNGMQSEIIDATGTSKIPLRAQLEKILRFLEHSGVSFQDQRTESLLSATMKQGSPAEQKVRLYMEKTGVSSRNDLVNRAPNRDALNEVFIEDMAKTTDSVKN